MAKEQKAKELILVAGGKGGVGKSTTAKALLDYFQTRDANPHLVETDAGNPDVYRAYSKNVPSLLVDLSREDGWVDLLNEVDSWPAVPIVVNTAARAHENIELHAPLLQEAINAGIRVTWLFMLGRQRESMEILAKHLRYAVGTTHAVLNGFYGTRKEFEIYDKSQSKTVVDKQGGKVLWLPPLSQKLNYEIDFARQTFAEAYDHGRLGDKAALTFWRAKVAEAFDALFVAVSEEKAAA